MELLSRRVSITITEDQALNRPTLSYPGFSLAQTLYFKIRELS